MRYPSGVNEFDEERWPYNLQPTVVMDEQDITSSLSGVVITKERLQIRNRVGEVTYEATLGAPGTEETQEAQACAEGQHELWCVTPGCRWDPSWWDLMGYAARRLAREAAAWLRSRLDRRGYAAITGDHAGNVQGRHALSCSRCGEHKPCGCDNGC